MLIDIWFDVPCKAFDPSGMHKRSKRLLFLPIYLMETYAFLKFFFWFCVCFTFFPPPGMVWIFLAVLTVLKSPTNTLHTSVKISGKTLPIATSIASGEKPEKLVGLFFFF